jgi:hypothetical protein
MERSFKFQRWQLTNGEYNFWIEKLKTLPFESR